MKTPAIVGDTLLPVLLGAMWVHLGNGWVFSAPNGGWEYPLFLIVISAVVALQAQVPVARPPAAGTGRTLPAASRGSE